MINPVYIATKMTTDDLTDQELSAIYLIAMQDGDPRYVHGYEKCKELFTQNNGTKMHGDTKAALELIVARRLNRK